MRIIVVWFKTDLRLHDNETLIKAIAQGDAIVPDIVLMNLILKNRNMDF